MSMWVHVSMINFLQVFTRPFPCTRPRIATCCSTRLTTFQDRWRPSVLLSGFEWFRVSLWKLLLLFPIYHMNFEICIGQLVTQTSSRFATATSLTTCCLWLACCKQVRCLARLVKMMPLYLPQGLQSKAMMRGWSWWKWGRTFEGHVQQLWLLCTAPQRWCNRKTSTVGN